ncbi:MAG: hypothetical protein ACR2RL_25745 [Gammaproteobacteria bacterium]
MDTGAQFFARIKKTRFDRLYDRPDCRDYYRALSPLEYQIPAHVVPTVGRAIEQLSHIRRIDTPRVLDVACGYGIAGALLRHDVTMSAVLERYFAPELKDADVDTLISDDHAWFRARRRPARQPHITGLDISANALDYAVRAGLCDRSFTDNLERDDPSSDLRTALGEIALVMETGGLGYIGASTFRRILDAAGEPLPWVVIAPTRVCDSEPTLRLLQSYGLVVERTSNSPFRHRRFAGEDEREHAIAEIRRKGMDPNAYEQSGYYFAQAYLARPADECV